MPTKIKPRRSALANTPPTTANIEQYELAINTADKKIYTRDGSDNIVVLGAGNLSGLSDVAISSPANGQSLTYNSTTGKWQNSTAASSGDVVGPASATDNALVRFDGSTGKLIQNSTAILSDAGALDVANVTTDYLQIDTAATTTSAVGRITWDAGEGTATLGLAGGNVNLQLGQENVVRVYNGSGATITNGSVVAVTGAQGQRPSVVLADADSEPLSAATLGIATENIANGAEGFVATFGVVNGLDTSAFTAGTPVYLSQTAGGLTATRPSAPAHTVFIGWVLHVNASSGRIFININNGWELDELHNVNISSVANNNLLQYDSANAYWKNVTPSSVTGVGSANQLVTGRTISLTGDVTYTSGSFDGSANVTGTATLANSGVTAGSYTLASITVDSKGRITAASSGSAGSSLIGVTSSASPYTVALGQSAGNGSITGEANIAIGYQTLNSITTGAYTVGIGYAAGNSATGSRNVFVGVLAGYRAIGGDNIGIGQYALYGASSGTGFGNIALGYQSGYNLSNGETNVFLGYWAGKAVTTGNDNVLLGKYAGLNLTTGNGNIGIGIECLRDNTGSSNIAIGQNTLRNTGGGGANIAIGFEAGQYIGSGSNNVVIGRNAANAGANRLISGSNNIIIGYNASSTTDSVSNEITLGNASITKLRVPGVGLYAGTASVASAATITPDITVAQYNVTALAAATTFAAPAAGVDGQKLTLRIKDNGTARALTWTTTSGGYRAIGTFLPSTTVAGKVMYIGLVYNSQDTFWDVIAVTTQI